MFAFDTQEKPLMGKRAGEWTAVGQTELLCAQTMAYCQWDIAKGRWPK